MGIFYFIMKKIRRGIYILGELKQEGNCSILKCTRNLRWSKMIEFIFLIYYSCVFIKSLSKSKISSKIYHIAEQEVGRFKTF
jgi:hypothetical protein